MAIHTPFHCHLHPWLHRRFFALSNRSVTGLTWYLPYHGMTAMGKEDMIRLFIYPFPGDFFAPSLKLSDLFLFGIFCDGLLMALQAGVDVGYSGEGLGFKIAVAGFTLQTLVDVLFVIERDGLLGFRAKTEANEEEE
jgi:hypothetical protein